jgi:hypothetical protein
MELGGTDVIPGVVLQRLEIVRIPKASFWHLRVEAELAYPALVLARIRLARVSEPMTKSQDGCWAISLVAGRSSSAGIRLLSRTIEPGA